MFTAIAMLISLVSAGGRTPMPDVCELRRAVPGKTTSRSCIGCHDGTVGPIADVSFPSEARPAPSAFEVYAGLTDSPVTTGGTHPVDVDYAAAEARRPGTLTPMVALPRALALQNGLLTCVTCHSPASREPFRVSLSMNRSALCFACHRY